MRESSSKPTTRTTKALMTALVGVLVLAAVELISWIALSLDSDRFVSYEDLSQQRMRVKASSSIDEQPIQARGDSAPKFVAREVIHPYLGSVLNRSTDSVLRFEAGGPDALDFGFPLVDYGLFHEPSNEQLVVAITGGSVARNLAWNSGDILKEAISALSPEGIERVVLVNLAIQGYKQPQQLLTLSYLLGLGAHFDVLVNLDGFNEVVLPAIENKPHGMFSAFPRAWRFRAADFNPEMRRRIGELTYLRGRRTSWAGFFSHPAFRFSMSAALVWRILDAQLETTIGNRGSDLSDWAAGSAADFVTTGPTREYPSDAALYSDLVSIWENCSLQLNRLATANDIKYLHFLQPNQYLPGSKPMGPEERRQVIMRDERKPIYVHVEKGYPMLITAGSRLRTDGVAFYDLTQLFSEVVDPLYIDVCCHLNQAGERLIAEAIADAIAQEAGWAGGSPDVAALPRLHAGS